ncbi:hypothetical protein ACFVTE_16255 [Arthrobacter sp. NPDC058097]|uniref:hypothetical protein n=1 Tax=Arthrobacter sp. NPDC058097 TaxID=3346340 RepID=UPI0036D904A4
MGKVVRNWADLEAGRWVDVMNEAGQLERACVDAVTPDGSIIWLVTEGTGARSLHLSTDPVTLYLHSE